MQQTMFKKTHVNSRLQNGVGLIELMVGLTVGILVVLAALLNFGSVNTSSLVVSEASRLEQQVNVTMDAIAQQIKQAGAMNLVSSLPGSTQLEKVEFENLAALNGADLGTRKVIVRGSDGAGGAPDTLTIAYSVPSGGGGIAQNCAGDNAIDYPPTPSSGGAPAATSRQVVSTLAVTGGSLTCGMAGIAGVTPQPLATNVVNFQVRYLVNTGDRATTRTATQVGANWTDWAGIDGVEICLHLTSDSRQAAVAAPQFTDCLGNAINADGRLHRVARNIFRLRNSASL